MAKATRYQTFGVCMDGGTCLAKQTPLTVDGTQPLNLAWSTRVYTPGLSVDVYAENRSGKRYVLAHQESASGLTLDHTMRAVPPLPSGQYTVTLELNNGNIAPTIVERGVITVNDTTAPAAPTVLAAQTQADMSALLTWDGNKAEADVMGYQISVDGGDPVQTDGQFSRYHVAGLAPGTAHTISVAAYDLSGNLGPAATVNVTTPAIAVGAAWPARDSETTEHEQIGASYVQPVTNPTLTVVDADGKQMRGVVTPILQERSVTETVTLGATFVPTDGELASGTYTATISAQDAATGQLTPFSWSFTVLSQTRTYYFPLIARQ